MLYFFHRVQPERYCTIAFRVAELLGNPQKHFEVIDIGKYAQEGKKLIQLRQESIVYCHKCIIFVTLNVKV